MACIYSLGAKIIERRENRVNFAMIIVCDLVLADGRSRLRDVIMISDKVSDLAWTLRWSCGVGASTLLLCSQEERES